MDHWLQPLAKSLPSYIKEFIKYIESTKLPKDCILCTLDVSSLYTNIPMEDGIHAALQAIKEWENKETSRPPTSWLKKISELILYKNAFRFNDKLYIQKQGTAMGTKMAPSYANIFMGTLESRIISETKRHSGYQNPYQAYQHRTVCTCLICPPPLERAGVSSKDNYLDTLEETLMKLRSKPTKRNMSKI